MAARRGVARRSAAAARFPTQPSARALADAAAWWPAWLRMWEIGVAAPQVIAWRSHRLAAAGAFPGARDRAEMVRMTQEKAEAWAESAAAVSAALYESWFEISTASIRPWWLAATTTPWDMGKWNTLYSGVARDWARHAPRIAAIGLAPTHRRATANAKRLAAVRVRVPRS